MQAFIDKEGFDELLIDPWDARAVREQIIRHAEACPQKPASASTLLVERS